MALLKWSALLRLPALYLMNCCGRIRGSVWFPSFLFVLCGVPSNYVLKKVRFEACSMSMEEGDPSFCIFIASYTNSFSQKNWSRCTYIVREVSMLIVGSTLVSIFWAFVKSSGHRQELVDEITSITDHHKLFNFLQKRKIVKDDCWIQGDDWVNSILCAMLEQNLLDFLL